MILSSATAIVYLYMQFANGNGGEVRLHSAPYPSYEACLQNLPAHTESAYANAKQRLARINREQHPGEDAPELILEYSECVTDSPAF